LSVCQPVLISITRRTRTYAVARLCSTTRCLQSCPFPPKFSGPALVIGLAVVLSPCAPSQSPVLGMLRPTIQLAARAASLTTRRMLSTTPTRALARNSTLFSSRTSYLPRSFSNTGFRSYSSSQGSPKPSRSKRYARRAGYTVLALGSFWEIDREFNASAVGRNLKTLWTVSLHSHQMLSIY
jgi:hypothetical protein